VRHDKDADLSRFDRVMDHAKQTKGLDAYVELFKSLSAQRVLQGFFSLDVPSHQIPRARIVLHVRGSLDEQHFAVAYQRSGDAPRDF
jgi:hypothetical protein